MTLIYEEDKNEWTCVLEKPEYSGVGDTAIEAAIKSAEESKRLWEDLDIASKEKE